MGFCSIKFCNIISHYHNIALSFAFLLDVKLSTIDSKCPEKIYNTKSNLLLILVSSQGSSHNIQHAIISFRDAAVQRSGTKRHRRRLETDISDAVFYSKARHDYFYMIIKSLNSTGDHISVDKRREPHSLQDEHRTESSPYDGRGAYHR